MQQVVQRAVKMDVATDIVVYESEFRQGQEVLQIPHITCDEIVHTDHLIALPDKAIAQVRSKEAGGAGNEDAWHYFKPIPAYANPAARTSAPL